MSPPPSQPTRAALTKIYTEALGDSDSEERREKVVRNKPAGDITAMYTQKLVEKEELASSPKTERKEMMFQRPQGMTNITQLYTAALKEDNRESGGKVKPMRNGNITKLYTEGLDKEPERAFKGKPKDEKTNPIKHNLATRVDKAAIMEAYNDVMADNNNIEWAAFTFSDNKLGVAAKGVDFAEFKSHFGADERGFGYIKITVRRKLVWILLTPDFLSDRGRDVEAVQVCFLHLGGTQRVGDEEGQDVDRQGPSQGHRHQPVR
jgi:hypothetical protein